MLSHLKIFTFAANSSNGGDRKSPLFVHMVSESIEKKVQEILQDHDDLFLVEVKFASAGTKSKLVILLDGDKGVDIDSCSEVSRQLNSFLEEDPNGVELIKSAFVLEVSSVGIDRPLSMTRQYKKNVGRPVRVLLEDSSTIEGELIQADDLFFRIKEVKKKGDGKTHDLKYSEIKHTKVLVSFR